MGFRDGWVKFACSFLAQVAKGGGGAAAGPSERNLLGASWFLAKFSFWDLPGRILCKDGLGFGGFRGFRGLGCRVCRAPKDGFPAVDVDLIVG